MRATRATFKTIHFLLGLILLVSILKSNPVAAQQSKIRAGLELDLLPYATGGYFACGFVGIEQFRVRALTASVNKPNWSINNNYRNNHIQAYALVLDIYQNKDWKGWWLGGGIVYWQSNIQSKELLETAHFSNFLLNGSLGYQIPLGKHFYASPWAGISLRVAGNKNVPVDQYHYTLPFINPEASLKLGYRWP